MAENEASQTTPPTTAPPKKKSSKGKCCLGCCGGILALFVFLILGAFLLIRSATKPIDLGINSSPEDFENFMEKTEIELGSPPEKLCFACPVKYEGKKNLDLKISNQEASAWFNVLNSEFLKDTQIKIEKDKVSLVTKFNYEGMNYSVFASGNIQKTSSKSVKITLYNTKVGSLPIPPSVIPKIEQSLNEFTNQKLAEVPDLKIEELSFENGYFNFKGIFPEKVSAAD